jgi:hypothetical protein
MKRTRGPLGARNMIKEKFIPSKLYVINRIKNNLFVWLGDRETTILEKVHSHLLTTRN